MTIFSLPKEELFYRQDKVRKVLADRGLAGAIFFHPTRIRYLTHYAHLSTERPIALILPTEGDAAMMVPKLEEQHLHSQAPWLKKTRVYFEFPGKKHPMYHLVELLQEMGLAEKPLGADNDGHLDLNSYFGPLLSSLLDARLSPVGDILDEMRKVKSATELELLRLSGKWAARTHQFLQAAMKEGKSERSISRPAEEQAFDELEEVAGSEGYSGMVGIHASFRSGARTAMSHAAMGSRPVQRGDNLVSYCQGIAQGYYTELERTMFFGTPTDEKCRLFEKVYEAQQMAFKLIKPGVRCAEVDIQMRTFLIEAGFEANIQHHQGHGLGLESHEGPFLDEGDPTVLQAGMVLSVEPGLYAPGVGGFRHSDTVAVTETGMEILTPYPRKLEDMVIDPDRIGKE